MGSGKIVRRPSCPWQKKHGAPGGAGSFTGWPTGLPSWSWHWVRQEAWRGPWWQAEQRFSAPTPERLMAFWATARPLTVGENRKALELTCGSWQVRQVMG